MSEKWSIYKNLYLSIKNDTAKVTEISHESYHLCLKNLHLCSAILSILITDNVIS